MLRPSKADTIGKFGHKAVDCRSGGGSKDNKSNNNRGGMSYSRVKFQGKCHHYRKYGHREVHCWEKHRRPVTNQDQKSQAAEEVVDQEEEVDLVGSYVENVDELKRIMRTKMTKTPIKFKRNEEQGKRQPNK